MTAFGDGVQPSSDGHIIRGYLATIRRRKLIVAIALVLGVAAGLAYALPQQKLYESSAQVLLSQQNLAGTLTGAQSAVPNAQNAQRDVETQASVARAPEIAAAVVKDVGAPEGGSSELLRRSRVTVQPNANLLNFYVTSPDPKLAPRLANAYAEQYRRYKESLDTAAVQRARDGVSRRMRELERGGALYRELAEQEQVLAQMEALQASNAFVVRPAASARQVQPKVLRSVLLGLTAGLVAGLGLAFLVDALDTRLRNEHEIVERLGGMPLLARLEAPPSELSANRQLVMLANPRSTAAEGFRVLATGIEFARLSHGAVVIMVTSAVEQEGKSTTISNLAVALARAGRSVALVDLDLRRPCVASFFSDDGPGVTEVAIGNAELSDALFDVDLDAAGSNGNGTVPTPAGGRLSVLAAGTVPPDPGDFVGTKAVGKVIDGLRERFDVVLIDAPPSLPVGDPLALSPRVDGIVAVARISVATTKLVDEFRRQLDQMQAPVLGVVVTDVAGTDAYSYYGRGYGHGPAVPASPAEPVRAGAPGA